MNLPFLYEGKKAIISSFQILPIHQTVVYQFNKSSYLKAQILTAPWDWWLAGQVVSQGHVFGEMPPICQTQLGESWPPYCVLQSLRPRSIGGALKQISAPASTISEDQITSTRGRQAESLKSSLWKQQSSCTKSRKFLLILPPLPQ